MIYGERVEQAREFHAFTQVDFARRIGCDQSMVAKIESGIQPSADLARAIARETGFPIEWFEQEPSTHFPIGSLQFRARADMSARQRRQAYQHARTAYELADHLLPRVKMIPVHLPRLSSVTPEDAAQIVRSECGLSPDAPITNVFRAVERAGALVISLPAALEKRDGFSTWAGASEQRPIINIPVGAPGDRIRWTTAHETGELVLSGLPPGPDREKAADRFAASFLLPESAMRRELKSPISLTTLAKLKPRWGTAMSALARRARELEIITDRQYRYLMQQMGARHWRLHEPVQIAPEKPRALRKLVEVLYGNPIDFQRLARDARLNPLYLRDLMRLQADGGAGATEHHHPGNGSPDPDSVVVPIRSRVKSIG
jgi:Zn-dependent peptidase ImmA (M78 family)/transcriptional regulator with XRE-family HTH domain